MKGFLLGCCLLLSNAGLHAQVINHCQPYAVPAYATFHDNTVIATTTVSRDGDRLAWKTDLNEALYPSSEGWQLTAIYAHVGTDPVPQSNDTLLPGFFSYQWQLPLGTSAVTNTSTTSATLAEMGASCEVPLNMAIYVVISKAVPVDGGYENAGQRNGFVQGPNATQVGTSAHGWTWLHGICCDQSTGCTQSSGYYKSHHQFSKPAQRDPWPISESTQMCGVTWLSVLGEKSTDAWYKLATQWITSLLNQADGASSTPVIDQALLEGETLIESNCRSIPKQLKNNAAGVTSLLESYNKGLAGPGACPAP